MAPDKENRKNLPKPLWGYPVLEPLLEALSLLLVGK
jgi:hypothetical protein